MKFLTIKLSLLSLVLISILSVSVIQSYKRKYNNLHNMLL